MSHADPSELSGSSGSLPYENRPIRHAVSCDARVGMAPGAVNVFAEAVNFGIDAANMGMAASNPTLARVGALPQIPSVPSLNGLFVRTDDLTDSASRFSARIGIEAVAMAIGGRAASGRGGVYSLRNQQGEVMRTGRTFDLVAREADHSRHPVLRDLDFKVEHLTNDYKELRGLEQILDDRYEPPFNFNEPISPNNPNYEAYIDAARKLLERECR